MQAVWNMLWLIYGQLKETNKTYPVINFHKCLMFEDIIFCLLSKDKKTAGMVLKFNELTALIKHLFNTGTKRASKSPQSEISTGIKNLSITCQF